MAAVAAVTGAGPPDLARDAWLRAEITDVILDGEPIDLVAADGPAFMALYTGQTTTHRPGVRC